VLSLCKALEERGHDVTLGYRKPPLPVEDSLEKRVLTAGVKATDRFSLNHVLKFSEPSSLWNNLRDFSNLKRYLRQEKFDILNVHHSHDHILGGISAWLAKCPTVVIRTDHKRDPLKPSLGNRLLVSHFSDGMITFSEKARRDDAGHFGFPMERVARIIPALNLEQIDSRKEFRDMRTVFGIGQEDIVIGMIARFQKYRRTKVFLEAIRMIAKEFPNFKVLLVGRSSQMEESVIQPMKRLGVEPWVILGGYRTDDYFDTLACMDIFVFLMGGSDGTARALREAMAMGKPVIVANRGMLPELVDHGVSGWVVDDTPELLAEVALQLLRNPEGRRTMGKAAREKAHKEFRLDRQVEAVEKFYQEMILLGKWKRK
jgi:glycosyltransferase involved in cell wall biosynthesis